MLPLRSSNVFTSCLARSAVIGTSLPVFAFPSEALATAQEALALLEPKTPHYFSDRFTWIVTLSLIYLVNYRFYKWVASW